MKIVDSPYGVTSSNYCEGISEWGEQHVVKWFPADSQVRFNENLAMPDKKKQLEAYGWYRNGKPTEILYRVNEYGFRGNSLSNERIAQLKGNCVVFLGCSNMFGIGEFEKNTIPEKFKSVTGENVVNLGQPGGSLDACVRVAIHWIPRLQPKAIFLLHPPGLRREIFLPSRFGMHGEEGLKWGQFGLRGANMNWAQDVLERCWTLPEEERTHREKNMWALRGLSEIYSEDHREIYEQTSLDVPWDIPSHSRARDLMHPNHLFHGWIADSFIEKFQSTQKRVDDEKDNRVI